MFERLQKKWKVNGLQLLLILCTFAIGGSLTGYAGRKVMNVFGIEPGWLWVVVYVLLVTLLWPMAVLLVSIPFGQFRFFTGYLKKIGRRMGMVSGESGERRAGDVSRESSVVSGESAGSEERRAEGRSLNAESGNGKGGEK